MRIVALVIGLILLLPGACSLVFLVRAGLEAITKSLRVVFSWSSAGGYDQIAAVLFLSGLLCGVVGIVLIRFAARREAAPNGEAVDRSRNPP